jgi:hypothetical protein
MKFAEAQQKAVEPLIITVMINARNRPWKLEGF